MEIQAETSRATLHGPAGRCNTDVDEPELCRRSRKCWHKTVCRSPRRYARERESCWRETGWRASTRNCKHLLASRPTDEALKSKNAKKMLNPR